MTRSRDVANIDGLLTAKGDIYAATAAATPNRLAVGANDLLVTAASGEATGLKYTGAWTSFTPTWTNVTVGNAAIAGKYCQIGKITFVKVFFRFGSTTAFTGNVVMGNPIAGTGNPAGNQSGMQILDSGTAYYSGFVNVGTANVELSIANVAGTYPGLVLINATTPMTWATNDEAIFSYWYEVA